MGQRAGRRKVKKFNLVFGILCAIYLVISILFLMYVKSIDMLPTSYFIAITIVDIVVTGLVAFGILKRNKSCVLNVVFCILAVAIVGG